MHSRVVAQKRVYQTLLPLVRERTREVFLIVVVGVFSSLVEGVSISLFIPLLQSLDGASIVRTGNWMVDTLRELFAQIASEHRLAVIAACILASLIIKASLAFASAVLLSRLSSRTSHGFRSAIFERLLTLDFRFVETRKSGKLLNALGTETWNASDAISTFVGAIITLFLVMVYTAILLLISWRLTLVVVVALVGIAGVVRLAVRRSKELGEQLVRTNEQLAQRMIEGFEGMQVIRSFGREIFEKIRFETVSRRVSDLQLRVEILRSVVNPLYEVLAAFLLVYVLFSTVETPGGLAPLLVFIFLLYRLQPKVKALDAAGVKLSPLCSSVETVTSLLERQCPSDVAAGKIPYRGLREAIVFDRVGFQYSPDERPALQNATCRIPAGITTALVGPSGAGKSTMIKLLFRFYPVNSGAIFIDDHPLDDMDISSWRARLAIVSQDVYVFDTTVRENVAYGKLDASEAEIEDTARRANAHEFITQLPLYVPE